MATKHAARRARADLSAPPWMPTAAAKKTSAGSPDTRRVFAIRFIGRAAVPKKWHFSS
jgi:hypothetical protein